MPICEGAQATTVLLGKAHGPGTRREQRQKHYAHQVDVLSRLCWQYPVRTGLDHCSAGVRICPMLSCLTRLRSGPLKKP